MDIYEARRTNLRAIMNARFDGKMVALAAAVDRAQSYLSRCLTPNETHRKRIGEELARDIEAKLGLEPLSLDRPKASDQSNVGQPIPITSPFRQIPIVGTAQLGAEGYWTALSPSEGHINFPTQDKDAYALRLRGDSMSPAIRSGWVAIIEPNGDLVPGEYVYIKMHGVHDEGESMVKELLRADDYEVSLMSINDAFGRRSIPWEQIQHCYPVGAIVPPSKIVQ
ncbi:phage repressor protein C with HTH and peptisase S24 domain [Pseudomonas oryzihabitans]